MQEDTLFQTTAIIDIDEQIKREQALMNTIKMEPIIEKTIIDEEPIVVQKKKKIQLTDYFLLSLVVILSAVFIMVVFKVS